LLGFDPQTIVPAILLSQALGGLSAGFFHHHFHNVNFGDWQTQDMQKVYWIAGFGLIGVIIASFIGIKIPKTVLSIYIGTLVFVLGIMILANMHLMFTWPKFMILGFWSAFNKGLSGGGYGPLVAGGQVLIQVPSKAAVAITDLAECPICLAGFIIWQLLGAPWNMQLTVPLCAGALCAPALGAWLTHRIPVAKLHTILGLILVLLGALCLFRILNP